MSHSMRLSPSLKLSQSKNPPRRSRHFPISGLKSSSLVADTVFCRKQFPAIAAQITAPATAWREEGPLEGLDDPPFSVELGPICSETQFDRIVAEAQQLEESLIIVWMASWCRKCIHLKPKLEKLAADHYPRIRFYYVDVNAVPHRLVAHAGVTKMPTIQLWRGTEKQAEVIGGHKAYLVVNEVREMIENDCNI